MRLDRSLRGRRVCAGPSLHLARRWCPCQRLHSCWNLRLLPWTWSQGPAAQRTPTLRPEPARQAERWEDAPGLPVATALSTFRDGLAVQPSAPEMNGSARRTPSPKRKTPRLRGKVAMKVDVTRPPPHRRQRKWPRHGSCGMHAHDAGPMAGDS